MHHFVLHFGYCVIRDITVKILWINNLKSKFILEAKINLVNDLIKMYKVLNLQFLQFARNFALKEMEDFKE